MTTITRPDQILRVAVAGQRELPEAARDRLALSWTSRKAWPARHGRSPTIK
ncbi:MAG: hypothetical protein ACREXS_09350 [Gammaproteobacteria bacterium]